MRVAVVAALPEEIAPLARRLADAKPQPVGRWIECAIEDREICLMSCGDGARSAHRSVRALLAATQPQVLIGIGSGGGLSANLAVGDLMVADRVLDEASGRAFAPGGSRWLERGRAAGTLRRGTIVSAEAIAWRREDKIRLARLASSTSAVVDLESGAWAAVATEAGVPFVIVRGVSDALDETLPLDFERLRNGDGSVDRQRVLWAACRRPRALRGLLDLRRRLRTLAAELAAWSVEVIAA
jgi:adenosylhomocysteine nucleosidase